jgi:hypothetical protein
MRVDRTGGMPASAVAAGDILVLRIYAQDPAGIAEIGVQCFQFSMGGTNKVKLATGRLLVPDPDYFKPSFEIAIPIPENAAFGKWGIQVIEFTNCRGYKSSFYRGQGKFDGVDFEVVAPPTREDRPLRLDGVEIAGFQRS